MEVKSLWLGMQHVFIFILVDVFLFYVLEPDTFSYKFSWKFFFKEI